MEKAKRVVRVYDMSFKIDAVRLVVDEGYSVVRAAESLGISSKNLYHWKRHFLRSPGGSSRSDAETGAV